MDSLGMETPILLLSPPKYQLFIQFAQLAQGIHTLVSLMLWAVTIHSDSTKIID